MVIMANVVTDSDVSVSAVYCTRNDKSGGIQKCKWISMEIIALSDRVTNVWIKSILPQDNRTYKNQGNKSAFSIQVLGIKLQTLGNYK